MGGGGEAAALERATNFWFFESVSGIYFQYFFS